MKKTFAVLLTVLLACTLTYWTIHEKQTAAIAEEPAAEEAVTEVAIDQSTDVSIEVPVSPASSESEEAIIPEDEQTGENNPVSSDDTAPEEEHYWLSDPIYSQLLGEYEAAATGEDGATVILSATLSINAFGGTMESTVKVGNRKVLGSGTNMPDCDNSSGMLLTTREGLPGAGTTSDRSVLQLVETRKGVAIYEATFFFGSERYPEAPFTAFRTYVALEESNGASEGQDAGEVSGGEAAPIDDADQGESPLPGDLDSSELSAAGNTFLQPSPALVAQRVALSPRNSWDIHLGHQFTVTLDWVGEWNGSISNGWFKAGAWWGDTYLYFDIACLSPFNIGPETVNYAGRTAHCRVSSVDRLNGCVRIDVYVPPPGPGYQSLGANGVAVTWDFYGAITIIKSSAAPSITNGNACYDLAGAKYGLYKTWGGANNDTNRIHTFTTNSAGETQAKGGLRNGYYYVKEIKAPKGYELDTTIYTVTHGTTLTMVKRSDVPLGDPNLMLVQKLDSKTGGAYGQDDPNGLLLADGEFTVRYWDGYYDTVEEAEASGAATRTWVVKTVSNGRAALTASSLVSGSDPLYYHSSGAAIIPLGTVCIQETAPPPGYLLPDPNPVDIQKIEETGNHLAPVTRLNTVTVLEEPHEVIVEKVDSNTGRPVADTEFSLYRESAPGAGDWTEVSRHVTDGNGKCAFSPVATGSYKLDETRANPLYAEIEESGDGAHCFEVTPQSTGEVQVFQNDLIQVAIEVYKKTIPLTNTALDGTSDQAGNHVGKEEYLYRFGARSNSNVRVDEFVITDSLEYVTSRGYRMTTLWTGTAPAGMDYDGLMHVLYKTNMTDPSEQVVFSYDPMGANPPNPSNPGNNMSVSIQPGWRIWRECLPTTATTRLEVADLNLCEGEYIIGIRAVYGGVEKGFYTGADWGSNGASNEIRDWWYSVVATDALLTVDEMGNETVMRGSIQADLFRNWGVDSPVLTDIARDQVETRVIETFKYGKRSLGIRPGGLLGAYGLPTTGDVVLDAVIAITVTAATGAALMATGLRRRRKRGDADGKEG